MLEFHEARRRVFALAHPLGSERVDVRHARARVLARSVRSPVDVPGFDNSAMDGYALCVANLTPASQTEWELPVVGESRAGFPGPPLQPNTAMRIFTGAPLPQGADTVLLQEDVTAVDGTIRFSGAPASDSQTQNHGAAGVEPKVQPLVPRTHVRQRGEDVRTGDLVIEAGTRLTPFHLSLLASVEQGYIEVTRQPRITILCTGDELRQPGAPGPTGSLPESNGVALATLAEAAGAHVTLGPLGADNLETFSGLLQDAVQSSDLVVTVGGVSVGDYDIVREAMASVGVNAEFWKVQMRPGKPLAVGTRGRTLVLGLPGNPVSAQVTACLFMVPLLRSLQGDTHAVAPFCTKRLGRALAQTPGRRGFYRACVDGDTVTPQPRQGSGSVLSMAAANALVTLNEHSTGAAIGELVETLLLSDL